MPVLRLTPAVADKGINAIGRASPYMAFPARALKNGGKGNKNISKVQLFLRKMCSFFFGGAKL